jgi:hypothetical protein
VTGIVALLPCWSSSVIVVVPAACANTSNERAGFIELIFTIVASPLVALKTPA